MLEAPEAPHSESAWEHTLSKSLAKDSTLGPRAGDVGLDMDPHFVPYNPGPLFLGFPGGASGKESTCQCRRYKTCGFDPWVGKIPWRRKWHPTLVFLFGKLPWTEEPGGL